MWVRGLKLKGRNLNDLASMSHPMWVRGLKLITLTIGRTELMSHPMWVRGLKLVLGKDESAGPPVAPYVGAWIETFNISCITV